MNVNRGNQFDYLVSMASKGRGLNRMGGGAHRARQPRSATQDYALGDVVNTLIRTVSDETILVTHDTNSPRPYTRRRSCCRGPAEWSASIPNSGSTSRARARITNGRTCWRYASEWEHPLWRALEEMAAGSGHGGMDFIEDYRLIQSLRNGEPMDMDVYDGAAWSAVSALSEASIADRGAPQDFPDFTRGAWRRRPPLGIVEV
jgi:hypothetical protein